MDMLPGVRAEVCVASSERFVVGTDDRCDGASQEPEQGGESEECSKQEQLGGLASLADPANFDRK